MPTQAEILAEQERQRRAAEEAARKRNREVQQGARLLYPRGV